MVFFKIPNPPVEGTVNSMEQKTSVFCQTDVQEFHLCTKVKDPIRQPVPLLLYLSGPN
jgi:hypothetical protein